MPKPSLVEIAPAGPLPNTPTHTATDPPTHAHCPLVSAGCACFAPTWSVPASPLDPGLPLPPLPPPLPFCCRCSCFKALHQTPSSALPLHPALMRASSGQGRVRERKGARCRCGRRSCGHAVESWARGRGGEQVSRGGGCRGVSGCTTRRAARWVLSRVYPTSHAFASVLPSEVFCRCLCASLAWAPYPKLTLPLPPRHVRYSWPQAGRQWSCGLQCEKQVGGGRQSNQLLKGNGSTPRRSEPLACPPQVFPSQQLWSLCHRSPRSGGGTARLLHQCIDLTSGQDGAGLSAAHGIRACTVQHASCMILQNTENSKSPHSQRPPTPSHACPESPPGCMPVVESRRTVSYGGLGGQMHAVQRAACATQRFHTGAEPRCPAARPSEQAFMAAMPPFAPRHAPQAL